MLGSLVLNGLPAWGEKKALCLIPFDALFFRLNVELKAWLAYVGNRVPAVGLGQQPFFVLRLRVLPRQLGALEASGPPDGRQGASFLHPETASPFDLEQAGASDADLADGRWGRRERGEIIYIICDDERSGRRWKGPRRCGRHPVSP